MKAKAPAPKPATVLNGSFSSDLSFGESRAAEDIRDSWIGPWADDRLGC